ncbi:hypothetical protein C8R47DRAFT_1068958 [Mycena vitilis]|nr:hypothetical protein C8R47DRAFT_1068958 [Mycena vitilis]
MDRNPPRSGIPALHEATEQKNKPDPHHTPTQEQAQPARQTCSSQQRRQPLLRKTRTQFNGRDTGELKTQTAPAVLSQEHGAGSFQHPPTCTPPSLATITTANPASGQNGIDPLAPDAKSPEARRTAHNENGHCRKWKTYLNLIVQLNRRRSKDTADALHRQYRRIKVAMRHGLENWKGWLGCGNLSPTIQETIRAATTLDSPWKNAKKKQLAGFRSPGEAANQERQVSITGRRLFRPPRMNQTTPVNLVQAGYKAMKDIPIRKGPTENKHGSASRRELTRCSKTGLTPAAKEQRGPSFTNQASTTYLIRQEPRGTESPDQDRRQHNTSRAEREAPTSNSKTARKIELARMKRRGVLPEKWRGYCAVLISCALAWAMLAFATRMEQKHHPNRESVGRNRPLSNKGSTNKIDVPNRAPRKSAKPIPAYNPIPALSVSPPTSCQHTILMPTYYRDWSSVSPPLPFERPNPFSGNQQQQSRTETAPRNTAEGEPSDNSVHHLPPAPRPPVECDALSRTRTHQFGAVDRQTRGGTAHQRVHAAADAQQRRHRRGEAPIVRPGSVVAPQVLYTGREVRQNGQEVHHSIFLNARLLVHNPATGAPGMCNGHAMVHFYSAPTANQIWDLDTPFPTAEQVRDALPMYGASVHREVGLQRQTGSATTNALRQTSPLRAAAPVGRVATPIIHAPRPTRPGVPPFLRDAHAHRPAIGRPRTASIAGDRGSPVPPPEAFRYVSFPPGAPPRFLTPDAIPTSYRDERTGYEVYALPTPHHPTLPASPRPDTPGLPVVLHEGRSPYIIAPTPANSQTTDSPGVAARAQEAWVRELRLRVRTVANHVWEQRHLEDLRRRLAHTARPTDAVYVLASSVDQRNTDSCSRSEHECSSSVCAATESQDSNADAEGITDDGDVEMTSPSRSHSNESDAHEEAQDDDEEEEAPESQVVDTTQKVRDWLMDDSLSDEEAMRELESSSGESDVEEGFVQRYSKGALKAREEERRHARGWDWDRPSNEARNQAGKPARIIAGGNALTYASGTSSALLSSISADVEPLSALTPPPPRLRLPSDIDCESPRPYRESPDLYADVSPTFSHPSNCSSSSYLDSIPSLVSAAAGPHVFLVQTTPSAPLDHTESAVNKPRVPIRSPAGYCTIDEPGFNQYTAYIRTSPDSPALDPNERTRDGVRISAMIERRTLKLARQHRHENQEALRPADHARALMEDRAGPFLDYGAMALGEKVQLDLFQHRLEPDESDEQKAREEDEVDNYPLQPRTNTDLLQAQVVASALNSLTIINPNGTASFRDDMGIPVSDDGARLRELSHDAVLLGPMYRLAIRVLAMSRRELIAFLTDLRSCMVETTDNGLALADVRRHKLDETELHQDAHYPPPYLHGYEYARLRLVHYTFAREGDADIANAIERLLRYRFLEAPIISHFLRAGLLDGNDTIFRNGVQTIQTARQGRAWTSRVLV